MEELCANPAVHNIQITYHMPHEVLKHQINYKYMVIETDKHVKIMFDELERIPEVNGIELYIQLQPRAEVCIEEIQQTTTSLQVTVPDAQYDCGEIDIDIVISVQNIMNTIPAYEHNPCLRTSCFVIFCKYLIKYGWSFTYWDTICVYLERRDESVQRVDFCQ